MGMSEREALPVPAGEGRRGAEAELVSSGTAIPLSCSRNNFPPGSLESQLPEKEEELELQLAEALGWNDAAMEACSMRLAGGSLLGSSTAI